MAERGARLLVPAAGAGQGAGHLVRCARLAREIGGCDIFAGPLETGARRLLAKLAGVGSRLLSDLGQGAWDLVILDRRSTSAEELHAFEPHGTVVCLDEGGPARALASYAIDTLPRLPGGLAANVASLRFLGLPAPDGSPRAWPPRKVLVSFGAEDAAELTRTFLEAAIGSRALASDQVEVIEGPLFRPREMPPGVRKLRIAAGSRLSDRFREYDLLVTHFGVTALEALAAGLPVILCSPSDYHRTLALAAGIPDVGVRSVDIRRLQGLLRDPAPTREAVERLARQIGRDGPESLADHLGQLSRARGTDCPSCGERGVVVARFPLRTWRRCDRCRLEYLERLDGRESSYGSRYFFDEYRAQYGRTYLEDFEAIKAVGSKRIAIMERVIGLRGRPVGTVDVGDPGAGCAGGAARGTVVDIGCAYGPFLAALRDAGWPCFGIDVSRAAVKYVRQSLGIPAASQGFERLERRDLPAGTIQAVSLWFVIEHLDALGHALEKLAGLLEPGGLLAFSTPNGRGISWRCGSASFLAASPLDHRFVLSPGGLRDLLAPHGFRLARVRVTGHHPERFPGRLGKWGAGSRLGRAVLGAWSRLLGLGDTFEAYAVRVG